MRVGEVGGCRGGGCSLTKKIKSAWIVSGVTGSENCGVLPSNYLHVLRGSPGSNLKRLVPTFSAHAGRWIAALVLVSYQTHALHITQASL